MDGTSTSSRAEWKTVQSSLDGDRLGPAREHENDGTAIGDEGERLVGRVEEEHPLHDPRGYPRRGRDL